MFTKRDLLQQRTSIDQLKRHNSLSPQSAEMLGQSIASSWQRSASSAIPKERLAAPLLAQHKKAKTTLDLALEACSNDLSHIAAQSSWSSRLEMLGVQLFGPHRARRCKARLKRYILLQAVSGQKKRSGRMP
jgi:hypothetical protein